MVVCAVNSVMTEWMYIPEDWIEDRTLRKMMLWEMNVIRRVDMRSSN